MKKNKTIFRLGALFFLFALVKYAFTSAEMSTLFIAFEILSFMVLLFFIYYVLNFIETCQHDTASKNIDRECIQRQLEIAKLKKMLDHYELKNQDTNTEELDTNILFEQLQHSVTDDLEQSAKNVFEVIKTNFELMAGIAYYSNAERNYIPTKTMGLDDEWVVEPIKIGEGIHGQAISDNKPIEIEDIPEDYFEINSGIGSAKPKYIYILPLVDENGDGIVIELAVFKQLNILSIWNKFASKA